MDSIPHTPAHGHYSPCKEVAEVLARCATWSGEEVPKLDCEEPAQHCLKVKLPLRRWRQLASDLNLMERDNKYPNYSYNADEELLGIQCIVPFGQGVVVQEFMDRFLRAIRELPVATQSKLYTLNSQDFSHDFTGGYTESRRTTDFLLKMGDADELPDAKLVLEVSFSEEYERLVRSAKLWIEGMPSVTTYVIANLVESPSYHDPTRHLSDEEFAREKFPVWDAVKISDMKMLEPFGPAQYKGFDWAAPIVEGYFEVWKRDAVTGLAVRDGDSKSLLTPSTDDTLDFRFSDFLDLDPLSDKVISIRLEEIRMEVKSRFGKYGTWTHPGNVA